MRVQPILAGTALAAGLTLAHSGTAGALPNCGGQHAAPHAVPYDCALPGIDITVGGLTRHFSAVVHANGTNVSVDYLMTLNGQPAPLPVAVPIRITHHDGISGAGLGFDTAAGFIAAGATTATLTDSAPCRAGQLDVMAVVTAPGSGDRFRVGGPWIENGSGCTDITSTVPATVPTPPTTAPAVPVPPVVPPSTGQGPPPQRPPAEAGPPTSTFGLPPTGSSPSPAAVAGGALLGVGLAGVLLASNRTRRPAR